MLLVKIQFLITDGANIHVYVKELYSGFEVGHCNIIASNIF